MADRIDALTEHVQAVEVRVQTVEEMLDRLSVTVDQRFEQVDRRFEQVDRRLEQIDRRFDAVDAALLEQRQYTEFSYARLEAKMDAGFARFARFERVERKLDQFIDVQLQTNQLVERRLNALEQQRAPRSG